MFILFQTQNFHHGYHHNQQQQQQQQWHPPQHDFYQHDVGMGHERPPRPPHYHNNRGREGRMNYSNFHQEDYAQDQYSYHGIEEEEPKPTLGKL